MHLVQRVGLAPSSDPERVGLIFDAIGMGRRRSAVVSPPNGSIPRVEGVPALALREGSAVTNKSNASSELP